MLTAADPYSTARDLANRIDDDVTAEVLIDTLPIDATVCVVGWPDLAGEALLRRGDLSVIVVDADDAGASFVRRLERADVVAEVVEPAGTAAAVLASDLVIIEATAMGAGDLLAERGSRAAASVGYTSEVPVWVVAGVGRCVPEEAFTSMLQRVLDVRVPWDAAADAVPLALASHLVTPAGVTPIEQAIVAAECPYAPELLRSRPG
jgi:translation initiation factor 2B subunit (eIF-2B alpha/beta/delta family)